MSYDATQLSTSALFRLRFRLQDNSNDPVAEFLSDDEINYLLTANNNNEDAAALAAARIMLRQFAQYVREREGLIEVYGQEQFENWKDALTELEKELTSSVSQVIIGGVVQSEVTRVRDDAESEGPGYEQDWLFKDIDYTIGGGSRATGFRGTRRANDRGFRLRRD